MAFDVVEEIDAGTHSVDLADLEASGIALDDEAFAAAAVERAGVGVVAAVKGVGNLFAQRVIVLVGHDFFSTLACKCMPGAQPAADGVGSRAARAFRAESTKYR